MSFYTDCGCLIPDGGSEGESCCTKLDAAEIMMASLRADLAEIDRLRAVLDKTASDLSDEIARSLKAEAAIARVRELCGCPDNHWRGPDYTDGYNFALEDVLRALDGAE